MDTLHLIAGSGVFSDTLTVDGPEWPATGIHFGVSIFQYRLQDYLGERMESDPKLRNEFEVDGCSTNRKVNAVAWPEASRFDISNLVSLLAPRLVWTRPRYGRINTSIYCIILGLHLRLQQSSDNCSSSNINGGSTRTLKASALLSLHSFSPVHKGHKQKRATEVVILIAWPFIDASPIREQRNGMNGTCWTIMTRMLEIRSERFNRR